MTTQRLLQHLKTYWEKCQQDKIFIHASSLAFVTILSLIPMLAMAYFVFSAMGGFDKVFSQFESILSQYLAPSFADQLMKYMDTIKKGLSPKAMGVFGVLGFAYTSISTLSKIEDVLNSIWGIEQRRNLEKRFLIYWSLLTLGPILLGVSLGISAQTMSWLRSDSGEISKAIVYVSNLVPYILSGILFSAIYIVLPNTQIHKKEAAIAGIATGLVFEFAKQGYAMYAAHAMGKSIYGSLAVLPVFLLWLYFAWVIVIGGAQLAYFLELRRIGALQYAKSARRLNPFLLMDILEYIIQKTRKEKSGTTLQEVLQALKIGRAEVHRHLTGLCQRGVLLETERRRGQESQYFLTMDSQEVDGTKIKNVIDREAYHPRFVNAQKIDEQWADLLQKWKC